MKKGYAKDTSHNSPEKPVYNKHTYDVNYAQFIFIMVFFIGYMLQFGLTEFVTAGLGPWFLVVFFYGLLFSWPIKSLFFCLSWLILENNIRKNSYIQIVVLELFYLAASVSFYEYLNRDGYYPIVIEILSLSLAALIIVLPLLFLIINKIKDKKNNIKKEHNKNAPINIIHGVFTYPIMISVIYFVIWIVTLKIV